MSILFFIYLNAAYAHVMTSMLNHHVFTHIMSYLSPSEVKTIILYKSVGLIPSFRMCIKPYINTHRPYISIHSLLYGQVQSGKTKKIMDFVQQYNPRTLKVLIVQNNVKMILQYKKALMVRNIKFLVIHAKTATKRYDGEHVLLTIHNKFRMEALMEYMRNNQTSLPSHDLIIDESDQYIRSIQQHDVYKYAYHILHVTATPFVYERIERIDSKTIIRPPSNYVGINDLSIHEVLVNPYDSMNGLTDDILRTNFFQTSHGILLNTCYYFVNDMKSNALATSVRYPSIPVLVISTNIYGYLNGKISRIHVSDIQKLFDKFRKYSHVILFANRMSNRGINYTNTTYDRFITHQITKQSNKISFIQKCRILGTRPASEPKPVLYCFVNSLGFTKKICSQIQKFSQIQEHNQNANVKITVNHLRTLCKQNAIKGYSRLKKQELLQLLHEHNIS